MVIGADGLLGWSIAQRLRICGRQVITTSRKTRNSSDSCIYLDLSEDISSWRVPGDIDMVFFCAAITSTEKCRSNPEESRIVNVDNTVALASMLVQKSVSVIFPSTNLIFDGRSPYKKSDSRVCPRVEYGRQKAAVEERLMNLGGNSSIVRFTKILGPENELVNQWIKQLRTKTVIHPLSDIVLSPISVDFASQIMLKIADSGNDGIWQVSGKEDITYEQLGRHIARKLGVSQRYVQPTKVSDSGLRFEYVPRHTTLDMSRAESELGFACPDVWDTIDSLFETKYGQG